MKVPEKLIPKQYRDAFEDIDDKKYISMLERECFEYVSMLNHLLKEHDLYDDSGTYTFPNGERWSDLWFGEDEDE